MSKKVIIFKDLTQFAGREDFPMLLNIMRGYGAVAHRPKNYTTQLVCVVSEGALSDPRLAPFTESEHIHITTFEAMHGYRQQATDEAGEPLYESELSVVGQRNVPVMETRTDEEGNEYEARVGYTKEDVMGYAPQYEEIAATDTVGRTLFDSIIPTDEQGNPVELVFGMDGAHITGVYS